MWGRVGYRRNYGMSLVMVFKAFTYCYYCFTDGNCMRVSYLLWILYSFIVRPMHRVGLKPRIRDWIALDISSWLQAWTSSPFIRFITYYSISDYRDFYTCCLNFSIFVGCYCGDGEQYLIVTILYSDLTWSFFAWMDLFNFCICLAEGCEVR